jgi:transketolase
MRDAFIDSLTRMAEADPDVFLLVGDLGFGVVESFERNFPGQYLNAGVAEQNMAGMAAGLASQGYKPFIYSIANFPTFRCLEQIRNDIAHTGLPVVVVSVGAGFSYGNLGYSHYALEDIAIMRALPGMRVLSPADAIEVALCMDIIQNDPKPTYLRLGKNGETPVNVSDNSGGKAAKRIRNGSRDLVLVTGSIAKSVYDALEVVDPHQTTFALETVAVLKPFGMNLDRVAPFKTIVTVEEHSVIGGLGSAMLEFLNACDHNVKTVVLGVPDELISTQGSSEYMRSFAGLSQTHLETRFREISDLNAK